MYYIWAENYFKNLFRKDLREVMQEEEPIYFHLFGLTFPVYKQKLLKYSILIWLALGIILTLSVMLFEYEMTNADIPGGLISGFLLAYLITILQE